MEYERLYRMSDSGIKKDIAEKSKLLDQCLKEEAEHGWEEWTGDFIIIYEICIYVAKMILRDRKMIKDCKKKYSKFTKKLIQVLAEKGVDYTIEKDECRSEAEIVKISYKDKNYQAEVFAKEKVVFFEKESYKTAVVGGYIAAYRENTVVIQKKSILNYVRNIVGKRNNQKFSIDVEGCCM